MYTKAKEAFFLCMIGGALYCCLEIFWSGHTHWTMFVLAALLTLPLDQMGNWNTPFWLQSLIGGAVITLSELISGLILNVWLGLHVWDYSYLPFNFMGQICIEYSLIWTVLSGGGIIFFDFLRWKFFKEEMPHYSWRFKHP